MSRNMYGDEFGPHADERFAPADRIAALTAEVATAKLKHKEDAAQIVTLMHDRDEAHGVAQACERRAEKAEAALAERDKDAERYRFLRDPDSMLDAYIDAAIKARTPERQSSEQPPPERTPEEQ
jgi:hypothetical protein